MSNKKNPAGLAKKTISLEKKLYEILSRTESLGELERVFWLSNYTVLNSNDQANFLEILENIDQELQIENESHANKIAEINKKFENNLNKISARNKKTIDFTSFQNQNPAEDEELLTSLREAGEI